MRTSPIDDGQPRFLCDGREVSRERVGDRISSLSIYRVLSLEEMRARGRTSSQRAAVDLRNASKPAQLNAARDEALKGPAE